MNQYWSPLRPVLVTKWTYTDSQLTSTGQIVDQYWFIFRPPLAFYF